MESSPPPRVQISARDLADRRARGEAVTIVDVREPDELAIARFPGALHIPLALLPLRLAELPADRALVLACHHGARSMRALQFLQGRGYQNVQNLEGGIDAWSRDVDPQVARY